MQIDGQTDTADMQMDRQTESKTDGQLQTARQKDGHTDIQTYRHTDR